jgi:hypothetical protein
MRREREEPARASGSGEIIEAVFPGSSLCWTDLVGIESVFSSIVLKEQKERDFSASLLGKTLNVAEEGAAQTLTLSFSVCGGAKAGHRQVLNRYRPHTYLQSVKEQKPACIPYRIRIEAMFRVQNSIARDNEWRPSL